MYIWIYIPIIEPLKTKENVVFTFLFAIFAQNKLVENNHSGGAQSLGSRGCAERCFGRKIPKKRSVGIFAKILQKHHKGEINLQIPRFL